MAQKRYYRRSTRARPKSRRDSLRSKTDFSQPRLDSGLKPVFRKIGIPEPTPFVPDPFQLEALIRIKESDVLVSAPTGAGKTWIAIQAIRAYLDNEMRVWYASPLKALSNSIYQQFCREFGSQRCGILTGDRKENTDASIIVGTTEILRNQLYDAMHHGISIRSDLVILDEAHYLSDPDRGVVWEEVLIYLPSRVKLLLLSATIPNAEEVCTWLRTIRGNQTRVVLAEGRPVPLEMLFLFPDGLVVSLGGKRGLNPKVKKHLDSKKIFRRERPDRVDFGRVIDCLRALNLLPAVFFLKSRMDCDLALKTCNPTTKTHKNNKIYNEFKSFLKDYPHLKGHRQIKSLLECRVASHHGGQLPYWKVLVEKMMNSGGLDAIFSTSTVAAGVNFPARTVALVQSDRFNGREFADLTATELHQMIGRAGRRGKDHIGFAVIIPGTYQNPQLILKLKDSPPEPIMSQIHINFSMTLNLLLSHNPIEVKDLISRSFAAFQRKGSETSLLKNWNQMVADLSDTLKGGRCDIEDPYEILEYIDKRSELKKRIRKLRRSIDYDRSIYPLVDFLVPGRLFLHKNGNVYASFKVHTEQGRPLCMAHNIRKKAQPRKGRFGLKRIDLNQIYAIFDNIVDIPLDYNPLDLDDLFAGISVEDLVELDMDKASLKMGDKKTDAATFADMENQLASMPCENCLHLTICHGRTKSPFREFLKGFQFVADKMAGTGGGLWLSFKKQLRFLKETGFVDATDRLTSDGFWASKLRLDQPLVIAEAIRKGALDGVSPEIIAGGLAPFVWDRTQDVELKANWHMDLSELEKVISHITSCINEIRQLKKRRGFGDPPIMFWPAAALFLWAKGVPWDHLLKMISVAEGDMASLVMRTADHLRQVVNLKETHPNLASVAEDAVDLILREPVYID